METPKIQSSEIRQNWANPEIWPFFSMVISQVIFHSYGSWVPKWNYAHIYALYKQPKNTRKTSKNSMFIADLLLQIAGKHPVLCSAKFRRHLHNAMSESALENNEMKKWSWGAASEQQMTGKNKTRSGVNILFSLAHKLFSCLQWSSLLYKIQQFMYIVHNIHKWQKLDIICIQQMIYSMRTST